MNKNFTPNMSQEMVALMDRRREAGDRSTFTNPDGIVPKKPWLKPDGTHKSTEDREDEMPDTNKKSALDKALEGLKKYVLSSAHPPAGMSAPPGSVTGVKQTGGIGGAPSPAAHAALAAVKPAAPKPAMGGAMKPPPIPSMKSMAMEKCGDGIADMLDGMKDTKKSEPSQAAKQAQSASSSRDANRRFGKRERDIHAHQMSQTSKSLEQDTRWPAAAKALNSSSMHVMAPLGPYDPYNIMRNATAVPTHMANPGEAHGMVTRPSVTYKSCDVHGTMHKSDAGCHLCAVQKSMECDTCGTALVKMRGNGGEPTCPSGH